MDPLKDLCANLLQAVEREGRFILGIDGLSRSGKTTLVERLGALLKEKKIPFYIFHLDDHIVERKKRYLTGHEEWFEYYSLQWDVNWLRDHFFKGLRNEERITLPFYLQEADDHEVREVEFPGNGVVIVEGVFLQRKEWKSSFDYMVYMDCPRDVRFSRENEQTKRNIQKFRDRYWRAEDYYLETEKPLETADLVILSESEIQAKY